MKKILLIACITLFVLPVLNATNFQEIQAPRNKCTRVEIFTTEGNIVVELYNETPVHRDNFLKLVKEGFYDALLFHRCIRSFVIQAGDPASRSAKPGVLLGACGGADLNYSLPAEFRSEYVHTRGALGAARMGDDVNPERRSSSCQFYIVQGRVQTPERMEQWNAKRSVKYTDQQLQDYLTIGGTPSLDGSYTVFGRVVSGLDVVEKISELVTDENDRPLEDIRIWMKIIK